MQITNKKKHRYIACCVVAVVLAVTTVFTCFLLAVGNTYPAVLFGYSFVEVMTGSTDDGSITAVKKIDASEATAGDAIAFYFFTDPYNPLPDIGAKQLTPARKSLPICLERITETKTDAQGIYWFRAAMILSGGRQSTDAEDIWIREDFIIGRETAAPASLLGFVRFISSHTGVLLIIVFPLFLVLMYLSVFFVRGCSLLVLERRLQSGELTVCDEDIKRFDIFRRL